ncbi:MAG: VanW family protein [Candidatus Caldatribacteriota bacterium]|nr:VanW family protein [Candidatus Caldatribacteriota bacterium]
MTILIFVILIEGIDLIRNKNKIYPGVSALGVSLEGLTREEAEIVLKPVTEKLVDSPRVFIFEDKKIRIIPNDRIDAFIDLTKVVERAYGICRSENIISRLQKRISSRRKGYNTPYEVELNEQKLDDLLNKINLAISRSPSKAKIENNRIIESKTGIKLDKKKFKRDLIESLYCLDDSKYSFEIAVDVVTPNPSTKDILSKLCIENDLASYSTSFEGKENNTIYNINLSAKAINGILVKPQETFSFNKYVGPAEREDGYKESTIIANGKFRKGYGGGVCQVSSTLYNALILGNFKIVQRYNHSVYGDATKYVPLGRDSGIFYGYKDLKFKNSYNHDIVIFAKAIEDEIRVNILGEDENTAEIEIISKDKKVINYEIIREKDSNLGKGQEFVAQEGVNGYEIKTFRVVRQNGEEKIELLDSDVYKSVPMIIREN